MASTLRKLFIGGNWKCNNTLAQTKDLVENTLNKIKFDQNKVEVVVAPVFTQIPYVLSALNKSIQVAAQNTSATGYGAYTGEIAPQHIKDLGLRWTILGHSERRQYYHESDEVVAGKTRNALDNGLDVIYCIGESLQQRESGKTLDVIATQLNAAKAKLTPQDFARIVLAYEPVWAIGTGKTASPEQAEEVHDYIRGYLAKEVSKDVSNAVRIIYGGSVTEKNAEELFRQKNIDGFLVGGASLKPAFTQIIDAAKTRK